MKRQIIARYVFFQIFAAVLCSGDSENTESTLNAHNYIIKGYKGIIWGVLCSLGLGSTQARTLISLISETMMGTLKAFHLVIKELLSEGEPSLVDI